MGFIKGMIKVLAIFTSFLMSSSANSGFAQATKERPQGAQVPGKAKAPAPTPAAERGPSNVELVNKALNPGASDPDVPLPHPDLANSAPSQPASPSAGSSGHFEPTS